MRTIIAGSRDYTVYETVVEAVKESTFEITTVVSGGAKGVDRLGEHYARNNNIRLVIFRPDWERYKDKTGKRRKNPAAVIRNTEMAKHAEDLVAIWDGESPGTRHMIETAHAHNLKVYVKRVEPKRSK